MSLPARREQFVLENTTILTLHSVSLKRETVKQVNGSVRYVVMYSPIMQ
jgi:hypothetical protein